LTHDKKRGDNYVLGIRAEPSGFHWAIVSGDAAAAILEAYGTETAPTSYNEGDSLVWIREKSSHILETYGPMQVAIRYPEGNAQGANKSSAKARCRVEGVILEAAASKNRNIVTGPLATFAKHSGSESPKEDLTRADLRGIHLSEYKEKNLREAILVAVSLLPEK
jgi:hypothetical protein